MSKTKDSLCTGGWNYRVIKTYYKDYKEWSYGVHEVFYDKKGNPILVSVDEIGCHAGSLREIKKDLKLYVAAFDKPVLDMKIFEKKYKNGK